MIDSSGRPTDHFGDPLWVFLKYHRRKGDSRRDDEILAEGKSQLEAVRSAGFSSPKATEGHLGNSDLRWNETYAASTPMRRKAFGPNSNRPSSPPSPMSSDWRPDPATARITSCTRKPANDC